MPYQLATNSRASRGVDVTLQASAAKTTTGTSTGVELGDKSTLRLDLVISAVAGTNPTLDVVVQTSKDNSTWVSTQSVATAGAFAQQTTTTTGVHKVFYAVDRFVRLSYTIGGTGSPSFTFSVTGEAV